MAAPLFAPKARRPSPLSLQLASMPALAMARSVDEKDLLPCIMITPSTPSHEADFELLYFAAPEKPPGFLTNIRDLFSFGRSTHRIALPDTPDAYPSSYGQSPPSSRSTGWSTAKRFRAFLLLVGVLFVSLHLFVLPHGEQGIFDIFQPAHDGSHGGALDWEGWEELPSGTRHHVASSVSIDPYIASTTPDDVQMTGTSTATKPAETEL